MIISKLFDSAFKRAILCLMLLALIFATQSSFWAVGLRFVSMSPQQLSRIVCIIRLTKRFVCVLFKSCCLSYVESSLDLISKFEDYILHCTDSYSTLFAYNFKVCKHGYGGGMIANFAAIVSVLVSRTPVFKFGGIDIFRSLRSTWISLILTQCDSRRTSAGFWLVQVIAWWSRDDHVTTNAEA